MNNSDQSQGLPSIVYKYRDWQDDNHKKVLIENTLWYASPSSFNDPFDCRIPDDFTMLSPEEKMNWVQQVAKDNEAYAKEHKHDLKKLMEQMLYRLENDLENFQREHEENEFKLVDQSYGVICLSEKWNNILMWAHYGKNHEGICFGFHSHALVNGLRNHGYGQVNYVDDFPRVHPMRELTPETVRDKVFSKARDWKYEEEFRIFQWFDIWNGNPQVRAVQFPDECFAEIILGIQFPKESRSEILDLAKSKNIPVFQAKKASQDFRVNREQIQ